MSATTDYIDKYSALAVEQQRLYGIPASITLAQGILESANGKSQLAVKENNHFGIKASSSWLNSGGQYALYTDDAINEKFCKYATVGESYEHHSKFLKNNSRYSACFTLSSDDYKGWANGLQRAGYATNKSYAQSLISLIEKYDLAKYDQQVTQGKSYAQSQSNANKVTEENTKEQKVAPSVTTLATEEPAQTESVESDTKKKNLLADDSDSNTRSADPVVDLMMNMFTPLVAVAAAIDSGEDIPASTKASINPSELASRNFEQLLNQEQSTNNNLRIK